jgi:hypothetical protein
MPKIIQWMVRMLIFMVHMDGYLFTPNKQLLLTIRIVIYLFIYFLDHKDIDEPYVFL